jgi:hypothetical protein
MEEKLLQNNQLDQSYLRVDLFPHHRLLEALFSKLPAIPTSPRPYVRRYIASNVGVMIVQPNIHIHRSYDPTIQPWCVRSRSDLEIPGSERRSRIRTG